MLIYSMSVSVDGYINDSDGGITWSAPPDDELFAFHLERVSTLAAHLGGRRLYETMLPWETDPALSQTELGAQFAAVWSALPKVVFSRTLDQLQGNSRLASASLGDEVAAAVGDDDQPVEIGGARLAAAALTLDLIDEFRIFRMPVVLGGGTPYLPPVSRPIPLELTETRSFSGGVNYARYRRVRAASVRV